jgi:hypothetical protein
VAEDASKEMLPYEIDTDTVDSYSLRWKWEKQQKQLAHSTAAFLAAAAIKLWLAG